MRFKAKKTYGEYKEVPCPFCGKRATSKNAQDIEVCPQHTQSVLEEIRCLCGSWLEQRSGKFGPYFHCMKCGNINFAKGMEFKDLQPKKNLSSPTTPLSSSSRSSTHSSPKSDPSRPRYEKKEITIRSDDPRYFD
jgi:hypothetical protein